MIRIAIDGPAGAGKSTVARRVAEALGLRRIDTGAMYRALTLLALEQGISPEDEAALTKLLQELEITPTDDGVRVNGRHLSAELRSPAVDRAVGQVARHARVRDEMVRRQRTLAAQGGVLDGRDIGTRVLPDADLKIFLTASPRARALRRAEQLGEQGESRVAAIQQEIEERDRLDATRAVDPLRPAPDAVCIDTTELTVDEVVAKILSLLRREGRT